MDKAFIQTEITAAMKAHDKPRLSILRLVKNEIDIAEKEELKRPLTEPEVVGVLKKVLKQTGETLEGSIKVASDEARTALLREQVAILEGYLPAQVTGEALHAVIDEVLAEGGFTSKRDMGKAIGLVVTRTGGNCDKAEVARVIGGKLG